MNIIFSPVRMDTPLALTKAGDAFTFNGETVDLTDLPNGATLPRSAIPCDWIAGDVTRNAAGVLTVPVILPHGANAPETTRFPDPLEDVADGVVPLPDYDSPTEQPTEEPVA